MAGDGEERQPEPRRHVLDEARLAAAGRPLQQQRQPVGVRRLEDRALVADRPVEGGGPRVVHRHSPGTTAGPGSMISRRTTSWL